MAAGDGAASFDDDYVVPPEPEDDVAGSSRSGSSRYRGGSNFNRSRDDLSEYRQPPHDERAERGVIGAMLLSPDTIIEVSNELRAEDFYFPSHQLIFSAILQLFSGGANVDVLIVAGQLDRLNQLERVGGAPYLHTLISEVPTAANARYYAEIVAEKSLLRQLVNAGTNVVQLGYEGEEGMEVEALVDRAQQEIFNVSRKEASADYRVLSDLLKPTIDELTSIASGGGLELGVPTGFIDLDELTNGLHGGQMVIVAARPGVGKSTLALDFMRSCSINQGKTSVIFSLEMSASEIIMRMLSAETEIPLAAMRSGRMEEAHWEKLTTRLSEIQDAPLFIDDSPNLTMMEIRTKARKLKQQHGLDLVVLDYLQLMSSGRKVESRQQEVSEFSRQLKLLAKELEVPVIAISQLNRGPEARTDKRPQLADLRESGSLEQDADMVFLLYRPDSQSPDDERQGEADIIVAKHRGGPIATITVAHQLHYSRFVNMASGVVGSSGY
ncbi:replicative DNA helicase [Corynebacterium sanguinis]|uniref:Replicative DNA helicase n=1 Tax=Corynebacterium sanguinis TaxID=2594913 RepID=A0A6C1TYF4_9CORY|nr:replicative DNA helicase [Corynebacterium sanguinis]MBA4504324.1 replicative DNA helicase [Corynebacterium sanguinis]MCT1414314.1 replicative DNA helicase [Corynebacterium sanguinis]MCT1464466.1 replicative DNA helicase [Corynebacterium sanguinis]MCT1499435.1 replicative DNA helicase [Corynebacterium sanguinis]MCT1555625.1 replicative DNA helicase [Corynebacterium sanguinis]